MIKDISIRQMKGNDLPSVYALVQNTIEISYRDIYSIEAIEFFKDYHSRGNIKKDAEIGYSVVAECGGEIVGTGTLLEANVRRVFVNPVYQNRGIGKLVSGELEQKALSMKISALNLSSSLVSRQFWESRGFRWQKEDFIPLRNGQRLSFYEMSKILASNDKKPGEFML